MNARTYNVLFICTGNSARSIVAEGLMNQMGQGQFKAYSAGSHPTGSVSAFALSTLQTLRIPNDGYRSKSWDEFTRQGAPKLDFIFTVCDKAAGELCPVWPGQPITAHWGVPDPTAAVGNDELKSKAFLDTALILKRRIELMLALPIATLDRMSLQGELQAIGNATP
jgi:arsenate reductase